MVSGITREIAKALLREAEIDLESAKTHRKEKRYQRLFLMRSKPPRK
jgi:HEPN domain-containing protein